MKKKSFKQIKRTLASILLAVVTIVSIVVGSAAEVQAKPKRCTEACVKVDDGIYVRNGKTGTLTVCTGRKNIPIGVYDDEHKATFTSSNTSVVSIASKSYSKAKLKVKKCGTATITIKTSCGNKFKVKIKVTEAWYKDDGPDVQIGLEIIPYDRIDAIYTYYKN